MSLSSSVRIYQQALQAVALATRPEYKNSLLSYGFLMNQLGIGRHQLKEILDLTMALDYEAKRPLVASRYVKARNKDGRPNDEFFEAARELGYVFEDENLFLSSQQGKLKSSNTITI